MSKYNRKDEQYALRLAKRIVNKGVQYLNGTMSPAPFAKERLGTLEPLKGALEYYEAAGYNYVTIQVKHCGSSAVNAHWRGAPERSYSTSRNGMRFRADLTEGLDAALLEDYNFYFGEEGIMDVSIDFVLTNNEIMPWRTTGEGLIQRNYERYHKIREQETTRLTELGFDKAIQASAFTDNVPQLVTDYLDRGLDLERTQANLDELDDQIANFGSEAGPVYFKRFEVLKTRTTDGTETIQTGHYPLMAVLDLTTKVVSTGLDQERLDALAIELAGDEVIEGFVVRPLEYRGDNKSVPSLKCRSNILPMIYGPDYLEPIVFTDICKKRDLKQKMAASLRDYNIGQAMLRTPIDDCVPENGNYVALAKAVSESRLSQTLLDPRL